VSVQSAAARQVISRPEENIIVCYVVQYLVHSPFASLFLERKKELKKSTVLLRESLFMSFTGFIKMSSALCLTAVAER